MRSWHWQRDTKMLFETYHCSLVRLNEFVIQFDLLVKKHSHVGPHAHLSQHSAYVKQVHQAVDQELEVSCGMVTTSI